MFLEGVTYGADPEFFLIDTRQMCGRIFTQTSGEKGKPEFIPYTHEPERHFGLLRDGVCGELNVEPSPHSYDLWRSVNIAFRQLSRRDDITQGHHVLSANDLATFDKEELAKLGDEADIIGCAVDYDAYDDDPSKERDLSYIKKAYTKGTRFAGGHIHLGYPPNDIPKFVVAKLLDLFCSGYRAYEYKSARAKYYGLPGLYRPTDYGIEYRTPGNRWIRDENAARPLFNGATAVAWILQNPDLVKTIWTNVDWQALRLGYNSGRVGKWILIDYPTAVCEGIEGMNQVVDILNEPFGEDRPADALERLRFIAGEGAPPVEAEDWIDDDNGLPE